MYSINVEMDLGGCAYANRNFLPCVCERWNQAKTDGSGRRDRRRYLPVLQGLQKEC